MDDIDRSFDWHAAALAGTRGPINADDPKAGFYRTKMRKDGEFVPVAYWYDSNDGTLRCQIDGKNIEDMRAREIWPHASKRPVTSDNYWNRIDHGDWLDDAAATVATSDQPKPPSEEISGLAASVDQFKVIESDEQAARGQTLRSSLTTLANTWDKKRKDEKEPFLEQGKAVDARWMPVIKQAQDYANAIRNALGAWEDVKRTNQRRADIENERLRRDAEFAAKGTDMESQVIVPNTPAPATQIRGGSGRAASVTVANVVTDIDLDKCFARFRSSPELRELFMSLADKAMKAGICSAEDIGAVIEQKSVVR